MLDTVNNKQVILTASEYIPPSLQLNFTGGTYFLTSEYSGKTITTNNATNTNVFVLPDGAVTTFTLSISGNTADQPISVIYGTGDTINTSYSKNYIYGSGETIEVSCASAGVWKFGTAAETVYMRFMTDALSATQVNVCSINYGTFNQGELSMSGKFSLCSQTDDTGGVALSSNYMSSWVDCTGTNNDSYYYNQKYISGNGRYSLIWSAPGSNGDGYIQTSNDYCSTWTSKVYYASLLNNQGYGSSNSGQMSKDGKYWCQIISGNTITYTNDYGENFGTSTIGTGTLKGITLNASGQIWYAVEETILYRSIDYGQNWAIIRTGTKMTGVKCSASGQWVIVPLFEVSHTSLKSSNFGISWTTFEGDATYAGICSHSGKYQGVVGDGASQAIVVSTDFGTSYSKVGQGSLYGSRGCYFTINADGTYGMNWSNFSGKIRKEKQGGF